VGICGTDRELAQFQLGYPPQQGDYLILGHEALGQVLRAGAEVDGVREGDWVVPMVRRACRPPCPSCLAGRRDLCVTGRYTERGIFGEHGYFAELAVDAARDVIVVPEECRDIAVLVEPLSVVEKAVATASCLHLGQPETALVIGAGTIGLLAAMVLARRGMRVTVLSQEPENSSRARLVESIATYLTRLSQKFDIVIEAAGSGEAARTGLSALAPLGVMIVLGAKSATDLPLLDMIVNNQVVAGSVNASPEAFDQAVADLRHLPRAVLQSMIRREGFSGWPVSIQGSQQEQPKVVHVIDA
jgi:glucose 1-dehydrogenase